MNQNINIRFANYSDLDEIVVIFNQAVRSRVNGSLEEETAESRSKWFNSFNQKELLKTGKIIYRSHNH